LRKALLIVNVWAFRLPDLRLSETNNQVALIAYTRFVIINYIPRLADLIAGEVS